MKLVFQHLPKTGGTSLHEMLAPHFDRNKICPERFNDLSDYPSARLAEYEFYSGHFDRDSIALIPMNKRIITIFREPRSRILSLYYFWRSHKEEYYLKNDLVQPMLANRLSLLEFLKSQHPAITEAIDNSYARHIIGHSGYTRLLASEASAEFIADKAIDVISQFHRYGIMEDMRFTVADIFASLGMPVPLFVRKRNAFGDFYPHIKRIEKEAVTTEIMAELTRLSSVDTLIYDFARKSYPASSRKRRLILILIGIIDNIGSSKLISRYLRNLRNVVFG